jgi:hypothetical protein
MSKFVIHPLVVGWEAVEDEQICDPSSGCGN